jgi:hypothetical protein
LVGPFNYLFETFIMKRNYLLFLFAMLSAGSYAQLTIQSGATFFIQGGATVTVQGDVTSLADIQGTGLLQMKGSSLQTINMNGFSIPNIEIDNGTNVALGGAATIGSSFLFTTGKVLLNGFDLSLASAVNLTGFDNSKYFVTNNTGRLVRNSLNGTFTYPVGFDVTTYNPIILTEAGTPDNIGVRCLQNVWSGGLEGAGSPFVKEVVDASWAVTEGVALGSNLTMTSTWNGTDELTGFNRSKTGISYFDGIGWDMTNTVTGAAAGAGPYTITRSAVTNLANGGIFAVGTRPVLTTLLVSPKMYLQGPAYAAGLMSDGLRSASLIPLTEPYSGLSNFTHSGSGGLETIPSGILSATGTGSDIVDWGFAQLHRSSDGLVIGTRAVLIQRDGNIVDVDGTNTKTSFINFAGELAGTYYVSIRHRNSLGARTAGTLGLLRTTTTSYDFTTSLAQAFPGAVSNNAMATVSAGVFGLWGGNANNDLRTSKVGASAATNDYLSLLNYLGPSTSILNVYRREDFNLDSRVSRTGSNANNNDYLKLLNILGSLTIINQPVF